eukprot:scaffold35837_cov30-Tisochrysis_lutea.AAC.2
MAVDQSRHLPGLLRLRANTKANVIRAATQLRRLHRVATSHIQHVPHHINVICAYFDHFADFPRELFDRGQVVAAAIRAMRHAEFDGCVHGRMEPPRTNLVFEASASKILVHPIANGCEGDSDATFFEVSVKALEHMNCRRVQRDDCGALYHNIADALQGRRRALR